LRWPERVAGAVDIIDVLRVHDTRVIWSINRTRTVATARLACWFADLADDVPSLRCMARGDNSGSRTIGPNIP